MELDPLITKFEANLRGEVADSDFTKDEIFQLYERALTACTNKIAQNNPMTFQPHNTLQ